MASAAPLSLPSALPASRTTADPCPAADEPLQRQWLLALAQQDEAALCALVRCHGGFVFSAALRLVHDTGTAGLLVEEVFWQAWRQAPRFDPEAGTVAAWLGRLVQCCVEQAASKRHAAVAAGPQPIGERR